MAARKGIACAGNWIVDLVKVVDFSAPENAVANILAESMGGGGCARNVTLNLAKFDATIDLYAVGIIGDDPNGDYIVSECCQFKDINAKQSLRTNSEKTSYTDVFCVKGTGRRAFFQYRGANRLFTPREVNLDDLPVGLFHMGYLLLLDGMDQPDGQFKTVATRFLHEIQKRNINTSIDLVSEDSDRFNQVVPPALKYTNCCIINDFEAEKLSGIPLRSGNKVLPQNLKGTAKTLFEHGVNDLVIIHFPEVAYLLPKDGSEMIQPSLQVPDDFIVGSTDAGDSFCAGMLYGLYQGWSHDRTLRFAVCAGAMNLSDLTTTGGINPWKEIFEMEERFPYRSDVP